MITLIMNPATCSIDRATTPDGGKLVVASFTDPESGIKVQVPFDEPAWERFVGLRAGIDTYKPEDIADLRA